MIGMGMLAVLTFHLALAAFFGSMLQPIIWTFWNAAFVFSVMVVAFGILSISVVGNRSDVDDANSVIRGKENK
jgi:ABC-type multidrug transport system permease subunit